MRVGGETYALPVENVAEIVECGAIAPLPGAASGVIGVRNLRAQVLPVFDLAAVLGAPSGTSAVLVIAEAGGDRVALGVDAVLDVAELEAASEASDLPLLTGTVLDADALVGIIDPDRLFAALAQKAAA
jgi:purine-binding chemotaxis protein CheW